MSGSWRDGGGVPVTRRDVLGRPLAVPLLRDPHGGEVYAYAAPCPGPDHWAVALESGALVRVAARPLGHDRHQVLVLTATLADLRARGAKAVRP